MNIVGQTTKRASHTVLYQVLDMVVDDFYIRNNPSNNVLKELKQSHIFKIEPGQYSDKGRTGRNPIIMYVVVTYANMRGVRAIDRIVELCERDLAFIWLTKGLLSYHTIERLRG